jgi:hypothetical protein
MRIYKVSGIKNDKRAEEFLMVFWVEEIKKKNRLLLMRLRLLLPQLMTRPLPFPQEMTRPL